MSYKHVVIIEEATVSEPKPGEASAFWYTGQGKKVMLRLLLTHQYNIRALNKS